MRRLAAALVVLVAAGPAARADGDTGDAAPAREDAPDGGAGAAAANAGGAAASATGPSRAAIDAAGADRAVDAAGRCLVARAGRLTPCPTGTPRRDGTRSKVDVVTKPAGQPVVLVTLGRAPVRGGDELWLPPGTYVFEAGDGRSTVTVKDGADAIVLLELATPAPEAPRNGSVDFGDEGGGSVVNGPPPKIVHPSLLPARYRKGLAATARRNALIDQPAGPARDLDRPRVVVFAGPTLSELTGAGWSGRAGLTAGVLLRSRMRGFRALEVGLAWQRRGGVHAGMDSPLDEIAVPIDLRMLAIFPRGVRFSGSVGGAVTVRVQDQLAGAPVGRVGADLVAGIDAELDRVPLRLDLRGELGVVGLGDAGHGWAVTAAMGVLLF